MSKALLVEDVSRKKSFEHVEADWQVFKSSESNPLFFISGSVLKRPRRLMIEEIA